MKMRGETREVWWECGEKQEKYDENEKRNKRSRMKMRGETIEVWWKWEEKQEK